MMTFCAILIAGLCLTELFLRAKVRHVEGVKCQGKPRSDDWSELRNRIVAAHPYCAVCGRTKNLQVHHIKPFHLHPELELDESNLIVLCEAKPFMCHLNIGHLGNFRNFNETVVRDADYLRVHYNLKGKS